MNDQMPTLNAPKPDGNPPPGASAIPADLRIADWIDTSDPDPELGPDPTATVGAVRQSLGDYRATECLDYWT